jgi:hypothetical protein
MKRKRISKERLEEIRRQAENNPNSRRLRELLERAWEELSAQGKVEGPPPAPGQSGDLLREMLQRNEARRRGDAPQQS